MGAITTSGWQPLSRKQEAAFPDPPRIARSRKYRERQRSPRPCYLEQVCKSGSEKEAELLQRRMPGVRAHHQEFRPARTAPRAVFETNRRPVRLSQTKRSAISAAEAA